MERASEESKVDVNFIVDEIDQLSRGSKSDRRGGQIWFGGYTYRASRVRDLDRFGYISFWQEIGDNLHLIPEASRKYLEDFNYIRKFYNEIEEQTSPGEFKELFDKRKQALIDVMDLRYCELTEEIQHLDRELGWIK